MLAACLGGATAMAYSPLLACAAARTDASWRASAIGTVRFWRDLGYAVGGLLLGSAVDAASGAIWVAAATGAVLILASAALLAWAYPASRSPLVQAARAAGASPAELPTARSTTARAYAELDESRVVGVIK